MNLTKVDTLKIKKDNKVAYTLVDLASEILQKADIPLSAEEIWNQAQEQGLTEKFKSKNPKKTLGITLARNLEDEKNTPFFVTSTYPKRFWLKAREDEFNSEEMQKKIYQQEEREEQEGDDENDSHRGFCERDLHPLVVLFAKNDLGYHCKTIRHEKSSKGQKRYNMWLHPDLVGVSYHSEKYKSETLELIKNHKDLLCKLISFELKVEINSLNLKKCYFQAVSNSSWANEGYLVALHYKDFESNLYKEMERLRDAFGIGFLKINLEKSSLEVLCQAKEKEGLDYNTINRLIEENNADFIDFINCVNHNLRVSNSDYMIKKDRDEVLEIEKIEKYEKIKQYYDKKII